MSGGRNKTFLWLGGKAADSHGKAEGGFGGGGGGYHGGGGGGGYIGGQGGGPKDSCQSTGGSSYCRQKSCKFHVKKSARDGEVKISFISPETHHC